MLSLAIKTVADSSIDCSNVSVVTMRAVHEMQFVRYARPIDDTMYM